MVAEEFDGGGEVFGWHAVEAALGVEESVGAWVYRDQQFPGIGEAVLGISDEGFVDGGGDFLGQARQPIPDRHRVFVEDDVDGEEHGGKS